MKLDLKVPCTYQGGKQRLSAELADLLLQQADGQTCFFDLCCGSGALSIELIARGIKPERLFMLDCSSWGAFWQKIGQGTFDLSYFDQLLQELPADKRQVKAHMQSLAQQPVQNHEAERYILLQSCSFGGKQIWYNGSRWENAFFRDYWEPTAHSVRRSPANPMQPAAPELRRRITLLMEYMRGVTVIRQDITAMLDYAVPKNAVVYADPPYAGTTGYAFGFDLLDFCRRFKASHAVPLFVSEGRQLSPRAAQLHLGGAKGGISGLRRGRRQEWLNVF